MVTLSPSRTIRSYAGGDERTLMSENEDKKIALNLPSEGSTEFAKRLDDLGVPAPVPTADIAPMTGVVNPGEAPHPPSEAVDYSE